MAFILALILILIRYLSFSSFQAIKTWFKDDFSLYNLSLIYANGFNDGIADVSGHEVIYVKDYQINSDSIAVTMLGEELRLPFNGLITKKNNDFIKIEVAYDVIFYIQGIKPSVILYEGVAKNEQLGTGSSYLIWSNEKENLSLLNYEIFKSEA